MPNSGENEGIVCSFCGKTQDEVFRILAGPGVYICNECIELCSEIPVNSVNFVSVCVFTYIKNLGAVITRLDFREFITVSDAADGCFYRRFYAYKGRKYDYFLRNIHIDCF